MLLEKNALISVIAGSDDETATNKVIDDGLSDSHTYALLDAGERDGEW